MLAVVVLAPLGEALVYRFDSPQLLCCGGQVDLSEAIAEAFGFKGLGILAVRDVPRFPQLRAQLLPLIHKCGAITCLLAPSPAAPPPPSFLLMLGGDGQVCNVA